MSIKLTKSRCTSILILILTFFFSNNLYSQNHIDEPCGFTSLLNEKLDDTINKDLINYYLTPGNIYNLAKNTLGI